VFRSSIVLTAAALAFAAGASAQSTAPGPAAASSAAAAAAADFRLDLGGTRFDPLTATPVAGDDWLRGTGTGPGWRLVQFHGPIRRDALAQLRDAGLEPVQYIHPYSYVVWADAAGADRAAGLDAVRWTGEFLPAYKVQPRQRRFDPALRPTMVVASSQVDRFGLEQALDAIGARLDLRAPLDAHRDLLQLSVRGDRYLDLARLPAIFAVQEIPQDAGPRGEMSNQSIVGNYGPPPGNVIVPGFAAWLADTGYNGAGVTVAIVDGGIRTSHVDLASRMVPCTSAGGTPTSCSAANNSHGTHVAGAVAGTGASGVLLGGFLRGQGVAPGANLVQQRYGSFLGGGPGGMTANGMLTIYKESALSGAQLSNNSWGPTSTPQGYDIPTQQVDMIARDANPDVAGQQPVLPVWSIMNGNGDSGGACAPSSLGGPDEAKNLFAVGSTKLQSGAGGTQQAAIFDVSANSAHGNACDGRRVPHIVAPGCNTDSTTSSGDTAHSATSCGTSMASPVVSGAVAVFIEKYRDDHAGATPSPALVKAAFTAAAQNLEGFRNADNGVMGHRPDRFQGYGRIDLDAVANPPQPVVYIDQDTLFDDSGQSWATTLTAADPAQPIRIMLAWTDAKGHGLGGTTPAWVNNLDLVVDGAGGSFRGNVIGADGWSATGGSADDRNNLEGVFLSPAQHGGSVAINVLATNIAADALNPFVPGAPAQDFALACYNCLAAPLGSADLGLSMTATPNPVNPGGSLELIATVANFGPDSSSGVRVQVPMPAGLAFTGGRLVAGAGDWTCAESGGTVACTLDAGSLPVGSFAATLQIEAMVSPSAPAGTIQVTGTVSATGSADANSGNDTMTVAVVVGSEMIFANGFE
jgi:subtilisin family serine protease